MPLPRTIGTGRALLSSGTDILTQIRSLALGVSSSARWWCGNDATLVSWIDRLNATSAPIGGSGTTLSTINGRACVALNGSGNYQSAAFAAAVTQPHTIISVVKSAGNLATSQSIHDGRDNTARAQVAQLITTGNLTMNGGSSFNDGALGTSPAIMLASYNGASSILRKNGAQVASGNAGAQNWAGITIGADRFVNAGTQFIGSIATILSLPGVDGANASALAIETLLRSYYGI